MMLAMNNNSNNNYIVEILIIKIRSLFLEYAVRICYDRIHCSKRSALTLTDTRTRGAFTRLTIWKSQVLKLGKSMCPLRTFVSFVLKALWLGN